MNENDDVQKLIRLKRYESPSDDYFERFLDDFRQRQRSELLNTSARGILFERVQTWMSGMGKQSWIYGAGAAYATLMFGFFLMPQHDSDPTIGTSTSVSYAPVYSSPERTDYDFDQIPGVQDVVDRFQASPAGYYDRLELIEIDENRPAIREF